MPEVERCTACSDRLPMIQGNDEMHPACAAGVDAQVLRKQPDGSWQ